MQVQVSRWLVCLCSFFSLMLFNSCGVISFSVKTPPASSFPKTQIVSMSGDSATVIPGPQYAAGGLHRLFFGEHYRDLWTTPIRVPVLNMSTFAGGLTPVKQTGGFQTKSLRLQGNDGRLFAFRSVDKDPKKVLPAELQVTFAADVFQDQISSSNPAGALVVDELANALGVIHPHPTLVLLPDDERLGEYRETFAGILGVLEDYPTEGKDDSPGFGGSDKIVSSLKMFDLMEKNSEDRPNSRAHLTARLLDIFVGDWDRHVKQWRWARFKENGRDVYYPIPLDRDQAFARFDGFFPWLGDMAVEQFESFSENFHDLYSLTYQGRFLDRRILTDMEKPTWDSVTSAVIGTLTDEVIDRAVRRFPEPYYEKRGAWIAAALKSRRSQLREASDLYYHNLSKFVDIHLSDKPEYVEVKRLDNRHVEVTAYRRDKKSDGPKGEPVYHRMFDTDETKEVRIYLLGGDDKAVVTGDVGASLTVRIVSGEGDDELIDESYVHGYLWGLIPFIPQADLKTYFYDSSGKNKFVEGPSCCVDERDDE